VVFAWANGASFSQICKMTDVFEGNDSQKNFPAYWYNKWLHDSPGYSWLSHNKIKCCHAS